MSTQSVTEKILADAKKEAQDILKKYRNEAEDLKHSYEKIIQEKQDTIEHEAEQLRKTEILRLVSQARLQFNQSVVNEKRLLIQKIITEALNEIRKHNQYLVFLKALILQSGEKEGDLLINERDWKAYSSELKKFFDNHNLHFNVLPDDSLLGGCTIRREKMVYHGSLELISELLHEELTITIAKAAFKD